MSSIMLLSAYQSTQSSQKNDSNDSSKSTNQVNKYVDLFWKVFYFVDLFWKTFDFVNLFLENVRVRWPFLRYFKSIQFIQSYQSLKAYRLSHLLYGNELTQSPINSLGKGSESIQSILQKNESIQISQISRVGRYTSLDSGKLKSTSAF